MTASSQNSNNCHQCQHHSKKGTDQWLINFDTTNLKPLLSHTPLSDSYCLLQCLQCQKLYMEREYWKHHITGEWLETSLKLLPEDAHSLLCWAVDKKRPHAERMQAIITGLQSPHPSTRSASAIVFAGLIKQDVDLSPVIPITIQTLGNGNTSIYDKTLTEVHFCFYGLLKWLRKGEKEAGEVYRLLQESNQTLFKKDRLVQECNQILQKK